MFAGELPMKKWWLLLAIVSFALLGQDRSWVQDREAEYHLVPYDSIRSKTPLRIVHERTERRGPREIFPKPMIQTKNLAITADEMEWNHDTGEIRLTGNVRLSMLPNILNGQAQGTNSR
jgi:hypothetical protein